MPRSARIVVPMAPHRLIQRGNRRQNVFFSDKDKAYYLRLLQQRCSVRGVSIWAYCLMDNHVHFVAVPLRAASLAEAFGAVHQRYTKAINERYGWQGFLWQGRFLSFPLDDRYLYRAIRYVDLNPVRAKLVEAAADYPWSSAPAHVRGKNDPLLSGNPLGLGEEEWAAYLAAGLTESETTLFREHANSGKPFGDENFLFKIGAI
jgi:putative transposase